MRLLYPDDPLNQRLPEELFAREFELARARGFDVSIFSFEDFERGRFNPRPRPAPGESIIYRGWMLNLDGYARLAHAIAELSAEMVTSPASYGAAHHLPSWYPLIKEFTAETLVFAENTDFEAALRATNWSGYFVKDYVKSLSTGAGSLVQTPAEIARVVSQIKKYRGEVEGGVCVRRREDYVPGSERRYFIARGRAFSSAGEIPAAVTACARLVPSPFFSVDTALRADGVLRIIEVGDGQVSDRKEWSAEQLVEVLEKGRLRNQKSRGGGPMRNIVTLAIIAGLAWYGYTRSQEPSAAASDLPTLEAESASSFKCDGRTHCSQMTSCEEATYFIEHCPNTRMDGNNDGVPCEKQWCR